ncbi:contractile injection system tape measure protein [Parabacteroides johnsonii]|uniref:Uncharacterized protein n=1 Tax=Parabacteroides johnsonii CL02T12C29 TaxID=999419 RepID=K5ZVR1_9BACT|nr:contractile injection system tape measure protein [Parabacteroides johnsonii]EKN07518.1 hypothetical protein HMPREF1077_02630 [Parabacteroides johnsonii CL02T12C29]
MIRIDHLSFEFTASNEPFAHGLYAGWDAFYHNCFERVVEECCSTYDRGQVLHEIERLELDLGVIPEDELYREFPRRLREELLKALPSRDAYTLDEMEKSAVSRRDNLLFFLKYGFPKPEWANMDFNPGKEAEWLLSQSATLYTSFIGQVSLLCLEQGYALHRLLWQLECEEMHLRVYATALAAPSAGLREKHRFLALMLEERPGIPVRFIHRVGSDEELQGMAALLESSTIRQLMHTEMREHAEVDLPPYWHYLYEWLIQYYPFNGLAVFGGKSEFIRHLHHHLLIFIRKRNDSPYLSKTELTRSFLLEVFGPAYYKEVLNAIYGLQPHNADGSPTYNGYLNQELYRIFMQLSLLEQPAPYLTTILKENTRSDAYKQAVLIMTVRQQPEMIVDWLKKEASKYNTQFSLLSQWMDDRAIHRLLATFSFTVLETIERVKAYLKQQGTGIAWLQHLTEAQCQSVLHQAMLRWIATGKVNQPDAMIVLLRLIYLEVTGSDSDGGTSVESWIETFLQMESPSSSTRKHENKEVYIQLLQTILADSTLPEGAKQRAVAEFWEVYREDYAEVTTLLQSHHLLLEVTRWTNQYTKEEIIRRRTMQVFSAEQASILLPFFA